MKKKNCNEYPEHPEKISSYFRQELPVLLLVVFSGLIYNVGMIAGPWFEGQLAQYLYDIIDGTRSFAAMLSLALCYVAIITLVQVMRAVKRFYVRRFANNVNRRLKNVLYRNLLAGSTAELQQETKGEMMTRAVADADACAEGMRKITTEIMDTGVVMIAYLTLLFYYDWHLTLLSCLFPPCAYLLAEYFKKAVYRRNLSYKESAARLSDATLDRAAAAVIYRTHSCEVQRDLNYEKHLADYEQAAVKANLWSSSLQPFYHILSMTGIVLIIWLGARNVLGSGWTVWNIAAFTTFFSCFSRLALKSSKAAKLFNAVQKAQVSWQRIKPWLTEPAAFAAIRPASPRQLIVNNLAFSYDGRHNIFENLSFSARPGEIIGVTGPVAGGKTTLGLQFLGEMPYQGSIRLGSLELRKLSAEQRRSLVAYMGHQPELLNCSLSDNILLGDTGDITACLQAVCLDKEVREMPDGCHTIIGSSGIRLSGGQQARVALARTLRHSRPLMVLDDPLAAVDRQTETAVFHNLRSLLPNSIVIFISHRLYLFPQLEQIIWLDRGQTQVGSWEQLSRNVPQLAALYKSQTEAGDSQ